MGLFSKKKSVSAGLIGVDIGAGSMKAVELLPDGQRTKLGTYGYSEFTDLDTTMQPLLDDPKRAAAILNRIQKESGMKASRANASLPSHSVFHAIITIPQPKSAKEDTKPLIEAQVKKFLPRPIEEMILDSTIIDKDLMPKAHEAKGKKEKGKKKQSTSSQAETVDQTLDARGERKSIRVLVSGAPKDLVQKYIDVFKAAKIELMSLETEAFGLIRSLIGKDKSRIMLVDIGYERANITVVDAGVPYLHRSIKAGGAQITRILAQQMGMSLKEAEQMKRDLAMSRDLTEMPAPIREAMSPILHEIRYSMELYKQQEFHVHESVEKIILTGGAAHLPFVVPYLTAQLDTNVYIGDPWARIATPPGLRPVLDEIGPQYSVAIGLAMKVNE